MRGAHSSGETFRRFRENHPAFAAYADGDKKINSSDGADDARKNDLFFCSGAFCTQNETRGEVRHAISGNQNGKPGADGTAGEIRVRGENGSGRFCVLDRPPESVRMQRLFGAGCAESIFRRFYPPRLYEYC
jgi:hypothetical protein